jgi:(S)-2-hydroxyglutarate dehydrogenase
MYDFAIIGGGIVGLSTGKALLKRYPNCKIAVFEKEARWAEHQTGHNSGVIHSGVYYKPGSLKAKFARDGSQSIMAFCDEHGIEYERCGKIIVATEQEELPMLENLYARGLENQIDVKKMGSEELHEHEPHIRGLAGIHVPSTGIVNFVDVALKFASILMENGSDMYLNTKVVNFTEGKDSIEIETSQGIFHTNILINCAGLFSDRIAKMSNMKVDMAIVPFRGEYYELTAEKRHVVKNLIYPVPNPDFPFIGVHFTRMLPHGNIHCGPNAVLAFKREGYRKTDINIKDLAETVTYAAFWKLAVPNMKEGIKEIIRSINKTSFLKSLQRLIPEIEKDDLVPSPAGVRAQAIGNDGKLIDDFVILSTARSIHVCNAPSPAATASIEIGEMIVKRVVGLSTFKA